MLATIRRDAPITFVVPEKTFKENLNLQKVGAFWNSLEFRGMLPRLEKAIGRGKIQVASGNVVIPAEANQQIRAWPGIPNDLAHEVVVKSIRDPSPIGVEDMLLQGDDKKAEDAVIKPIINPVEFQKTAIALWLVTSRITNPTIEDIYQFAQTENFVEASQIICAELDKKGLRTVYEDIELPLISIIQKMETRGIKINKKLLAELSKKYHTVLAQLERDIWKHAGMEFNIASPKQLGEVLFDRLGLKIKNAKKTEGGARSTRESELEKMRDMHPIVPFIFEYREIAKLLGTYIDAIPPLLDEHNRLHTHFIQTGSSTGRMASQDPGLQNIPIKTELGKNIRYAFIPEKGFKLVSLDYSQVELRIAAFMSGDEKLIKIFREGQDVHTAVAASVFKVDPADVTAEMRRRAKVINFGIIYGMGVLALKQNLGSTREEAQSFLNEYFATFSTLAQYLDRVKADATRTGFTETFYGRRRYFEGIKSKIPYVRAAAERMAINAPIQGTGADVIKLAMIKIDHYITQNKLEEVVFPLLQVHDELVCEIREDRAVEITQAITHIMESVMDPKDTQGVVLTAHAVIGDSWGELK
jgi:DNA polymerase I